MPQPAACGKSAHHTAPQHPSYWHQRTHLPNQLSLLRLPSSLRALCRCAALRALAFMHRSHAAAGCSSIELPAAATGSSGRTTMLIVLQLLQGWLATYIVLLLAGIPSCPARCAGGDSSRCCCRCCCSTLCVRCCCRDCHVVVAAAIIIAITVALRVELRMQGAEPLATTAACEGAPAGAEQQQEVQRLQQLVQQLEEQLS